MSKKGNFKWGEESKLLFEEDNNGSFMVAQPSNDNINPKEYRIGIDPVDEFYKPEVYSFINVYKAFFCINESITKLKRTSKLNVVKYRRK